MTIWKQISARPARTEETSGRHSPSARRASYCVTSSCSGPQTMHQLTHIRRNPRDPSSALDAPKGPFGPSVTSTSSDNLNCNNHKMQLKRKRITQPRRHPPISGILKNISPTASPERKRTRARSWLPPDIDSKTNRRLLPKRKRKRKPRKMLQLFLVPKPSSKKSALKPAHDPLDSTATECLPSGTPVQTVLSLSRSPDPAFLDNNFVT